MVGLVLVTPTRLFFFFSVLSILWFLDGESKRLIGKDLVPRENTDDYGASSDFLYSNISPHPSFTCLITLLFCLMWTGNELKNC